MKRSEKGLLLTLVFFFTPLLYSFSQEMDFFDPAYQSAVGFQLSPADMAMLEGLPVLSLPDEYRNMDLPAVVDNSEHPYLRPIFSQTVYPNCMQSTSIAYNFTYEINRLRGLPSDVPENQYTTHFSWNFYNGGDGWYGVNYLHTLDVLKKFGNPTSEVYGGFYNGGGERWMSGYDSYYLAMQNRLDAMYAIPVGTEEGILTLKHWLHHHMEGSDVGGVASFIACSPWTLMHLPEGTPEEYKYFIPFWCDMALHGMTIIGYNDSIRFDYNGDGSYTNDLDINLDGVVNVRDWEIGGFKFANSYDTTWADQGYSYVMYKAIADPISDGGIWGNVVHVLFPKEIYKPEITYKIALKHNSREMIKVTAGISPDTSQSYPTAILDFPIFNYQGGDKYMQGSDTLEENQIIEFGLDVTPLLSHVIPGQPARFFLMVDERDPYNKRSGEILSFSLMDYTGGLAEIPCDQSNIPLLDNFTTKVSLTALVQVDVPKILNDELSPYIPGEPYESVLDAAGGTPPYKWELLRKYSSGYGLADFPEMPGTQLYPGNGQDTVFSFALGFDFPFFGQTYDTIFVNAFGFLSFGEVTYWPYTWKQKEFFRSIRCISPFKSKQAFANEDAGDGLWVEAGTDEALFYWDLSARDNPYSSDLVYAVKIKADGTIIFYYDRLVNKDFMEWTGGISNGDNLNSHFVEWTDARLIPAGSSVVFTPGHYPEEYSISEDGVLSFYSTQEQKIFDVDVYVTDQSYINDHRRLVFSDALLIDLIVHGGNDTVIEYAENLVCDLRIKNLSASAINDLSCILHLGAPFIQEIDMNEQVPLLSAYQEMLIPGAFKLKVNPDVPDKHSIGFNLEASAAGKSWSRMINRNIKSPALYAGRVEVIDGDNGRLDPGETAELAIFAFNKGHAVTGPLFVTLQSDDAYVQVTGAMGMEAQPIQPGTNPSFSFDIVASDNAPNGHFAKFILSIQDQRGVTTVDTVSIMIGKMPVLVVDLDPKNLSGPAVISLLQSMGIPHQYTMGFLSEGLDNYQSVFLFLGKHFANHILTWEQGTILAAYLNNGGRLYMEGRVTWQDTWTPVHGMFSLGIVTTPALYENILGIDSTFTEGFGFKNNATPPFSYYYLNPSPPAYTIFESEAEEFPCGVAYETPVYKTIATIFEFGELQDDTSSTSDLMAKILDFFDIVLTTADIQEPGYDPLVGNLSCYPNPFRNSTSISFLLSRDSRIDLEIFTLSGQKVAGLIEGEYLRKGEHSIEWDFGLQGTGLPGGIYFYRLTTGQEAVTGKMILMR
ncbi:MAG: T9SS type A sorting domain-containing protein [Bacteroidetes bacterium]|nr:T9SS type A sorting domain-containing protein [Bacteroidota bacterium]